MSQSEQVNPRPRDKNRGFTIIELLVVIVVIAILAAITIVAYRGISQRAIVSSLSSDLDNASKQLKLAQIDSGNYPVANDCSTPPAPNTICLKASPNTTYQYTVNNSTTPPTFCLTATNGSTSYFTTNDATPTAGGCPGHGTGGTAAITNLHTNPSVSTSTDGWAATPAGGAITAGHLTSPGPTSFLTSLYRVTITATQTSSPLTVLTGNSIAVQPSTQYVASVYVRLSSALASGPRIDVTEFAPNGTDTTSFHQGATGSNATGVWTRISNSFTTTATTAYCRIMVNYSGPTTLPVNSTIDTTGVMLTQSSMLYNYADGNAPNWVWNGTPNNSTSTGPAL